jgi:hypothetical protein
MHNTVFSVQYWRQRLQFSRSELLFLGIVSLGIFLRVWKLQETMIFFSDAGRDMIVSLDMAQHGKIPLLGIPSSVPQFRQGPVFIWMMASVFFCVRLQSIVCWLCL